MAIWSRVFPKLVSNDTETGGASKEAFLITTATTPANNHDRQYR